MYVFIHLFLQLFISYVVFLKFTTYEESQKDKLKTIFSYENNNVVADSDNDTVSNPWSFTLLNLKDKEQI